jgi:hypothetical protein
MQLCKQHSHPTTTGSSVEPNELSEALLSSAQVLPLAPSANPSERAPANPPPTSTLPSPTAPNISGGALPTCRAAGVTGTSPLLLLQVGSSLLFGVVAAEGGAEPEAAANPSPICSEQSAGPAGAAAASSLPEGADASMPANGDDMTRSDTGGAPACMSAICTAAASCCRRAVSLPAAAGHTDGCTINAAWGQCCACCCCCCCMWRTSTLLQPAAPSVDSRCSFLCCCEGLPATSRCCCCT